MVTTMECRCWLRGGSSAAMRVTSVITVTDLFATLATGRTVSMTMMTHRRVNTDRLRQIPSAKQQQKKKEPKTSCRPPPPPSRTNRSISSKGSCHDAHTKTYPYILQSTDGSNRKCRERCNLVTPLESYRGYENYPREKKCACLYDASFTTTTAGRTIWREGEGGRGISRERRGRVRGLRRRIVTNFIEL